MRCWIPLAAAIASAACGGSGTVEAGGTTALSLPPSSALAAKCSVPRTGTDPTTGAAYPDKPGTAVDEKSWLRSWSDELYLWYRELPKVDPAGPETVPAYFKLMKTTGATGSWKPKDRFHFSLPTADWIASTKPGVRPGYGVQWIVLSGMPPRKVLAAYTQTGSPAAAQCVTRGVQVLKVDGEDLVGGDTLAILDKLNRGLFPSTAKELHTFEVQDLNGSKRTIYMESANLPSAPVQWSRTFPTAPTVGYILFHDHLATAQAQLIAAVTELQAAKVEDLVLDIRYNGGGHLAIASELAYMIAGPDRTAGKTFERRAFNDKHPAINPVTGRPLSAMTFVDKSLNLGSMAADQRLPHLDLKRVFVLTGKGTCSTSESIINGLRGVDVEVIQIGTPTCGKPYGFYPKDNCGTTYFTIQFQGLNHKGFGDYGDGFKPGVGGPAGPPGCRAADDFTHELGDPNEGRLAAALFYAAKGTCPPTPLGAGTEEAPDGALVRSFWQENRIVE
jgi:hypothetical protein